MTATFYVGDAIETMNKLPGKSVDLILTSPPFLALRSYLPADHPDKALEGGSQATPGAFIDWLIDVVEACDRVLAPHGSMCIELGDTYSGSPASGQRDDQWFPTYADAYPRREYVKSGTDWPLAKSLSLIPELFRLTLVYGTNPLTGRTTERWRLRNVVRWVRPNPPVGALGDKFRPATSELMVFCKSAKRYFDLDAVRTPSELPSDYGTGSMNNHAADIEQGRSQVKRVGGGVANAAGAPPLDWWNIPLLEGEEPTKGGPKVRQTIPEVGGPKEKQAKALQNGTSAAMADRTYHQRGGAPPLDWWEIPPGGYQGSHYAVFPPELCIKPIKAMCPEKVCRVCGEPSRRIVDYEREVTGRELTVGSLGGSRIKSSHGGQAVHIKRDTTGFSDCGCACIQCGGQTKVPLGIHEPGAENPYTEPTIEYGPCPSCLGSGNHGWRPGLVLDPFGGSGTTALVATGHGRDCILIDKEPGPG